jgi:hypothetical protein
MYIFVIDAENRVTAHAATRPVHLPKAGCKFADAKELACLIAGWRLTRLVEIWNKLPNVKHVLRFADRGIAVKRIWGAVQALRPAKQRGIPGRGRSPAKTDPVRRRTKTDRIVALLNGRQARRSTTLWRRRDGSVTAYAGLSAVNYQSG